MEGESGDGRMRVLEMMPFAAVVFLYVCIVAFPFTSLCSHPFHSQLYVVEDLFNLFDENRDGNIDFPEMVQGVAMCCRRVVKEKAECETSLCALQYLTPPSE